MNIKLINRQNLIRRLRLASVSFALLLLPIETWAEDYNLCVGETQVTSENASNIFAGDEVNDGKVSFDALTNTLTMNGAEIEGDISTQLAALTIHLTGDNSLKRIQGDEEGSLTFTGTGTLSLDNGDGVIRDFSGVDFGNFNLLSNSSPGGVHWDEETMSLKNYDNNAVGNLTLTTTTVYPLWVFDEDGYRQVTADNKTNVLGDDYSSVSYDGNGTLKVKGAQIAGRCFLPVSVGPIPDVDAGSRLSIRFDDNASGISTTLNDNGGTANDNAIYDLQGRKVSEFGIQSSELSKGLYIFHSKKTFIK